jgi:hypothetical protein
MRYLPTGRDYFAGVQMQGVASIQCGVGTTLAHNIIRDQNVESQIKKLEQKQLPTVMLRGNNKCWVAGGAC